MPSSVFEINKRVRDRYYKGWVNKIIRVYFYLNQGLDLLNQFKYLLGGVLGLYYLLKLDNYKWMIFMVGVSLPILTVAGYIWVYRAKKSIDWFTLEYTTYYNKYTIEMQERQIELLEKLNEKLDKLK